MPLSNTTLSTLSGAPYHDDYDRSKGFHRVLIRTSQGGRRPIQARELNQIQSLAQNQVEQLGAGIFREGAAVVGGNFTFANNVLALQVVRDDAVDINNFYDANTGVGAVVRGATSTAEGRVVQVTRQTGEDYSAVIVAPLTSNTFVGGEGVLFVNSVSNSTIATMTVAPDPVHTRNAAVFSVEAGTFFLRGHLVEVGRQSLVINSSSSAVTARLGFVVSETIVTYVDDTSLLDPALETTNFAAPGADRLKLVGTLSSRPVVGTTAVEQNSDEDFIEIARVVNGALVQSTDRLNPSLVEDTMARRTHDESGDYVVRPFRLSVKNHDPAVNVPNVTGTVTGNTSSTTILSGGVATAFDTELAVGDVLVVNGERRAIASVINASALTVNSTFSSDFTNVTAVAVSSNKLTLELDAGKAYVRGYEFETLGVTKLSVDRPRTTESATNVDTGTFFGPYVFATRTGALPNLSETPQMDLHCVPFASINATANATYHASKIGTAHLRSMIYHSGAGDANTVYKLYLVNAELTNKTFTYTAGANSDTQLTGTITATSNTLGDFLVLTQNASSSTGSILPTGNLAYIGAKLTIYDNDGGPLDYYVLASNSVTTGNLTTMTLQTSSSGFFDTINTTSNVTVTFTDKALRGVTESNALAQGATVSVLSKVGNVDTGNTMVSGVDRTSLIFPFRHQWIAANTIADENFQAVRYFSAVSGSTENGTHTVYTLNVPSNEEFYPALSVAANFAVSNSTGGFVPLKDTNAVVSISTTQALLYLPAADVGTGTIDAYARVSVDTANPRTKTLYLANTNVNSVQVSSGVLVSNLSNHMGHIAINTINTASSRVVGLGVPDVYRVQAVYAVANANSVGTWVDVTSRYDLDPGQRDWCYDHAALTLKPGYGHYDAPQMVVMVDRFAHSSSNGYFTAESYIGSGLTDEYADIPVFSNPVTGTTVILRDCIDFRPVRTANVAAANTATNPYVSATRVFSSQVLPYPDATFQSDYDYYLPRIDKVVLTKGRKFSVIQGVPSLSPKSPADVQDGLTLYVVTYPPYTVAPDVVQAVAFEYRRYTMRDIGRLEKRIENLEYYVQLSLLEQQTLNTPEFDEFDVERFKNGILVEPFVSFAVANVLDPDYAAAIDSRSRELRPSFVQQGWGLGVHDANNSTGVTKTGNSFVTVSYTTQAFISQPLASKLVNINPFNVASWNGVVKLTPASDTWFDVTRLPDVNVNLFNENDGWLAGADRSFGITWNDWETHWHGEPRTTSETIDSYTGKVEGDTDRGGNGNQRDQWIDVIQTTTTQSGLSVRTGYETIGTASFVTRSLGDRVIDMGVSPYVRAANVVVEVVGVKPGTTLTAFIDETDVSNYMERANEVLVANSTVASAFTLGERITSNGATTGSALLVGRSNNVLRVVNATGVFYASGANVNITGVTSGATGAVSDYIHAHGQVESVTNTTTFVLDAGASSNNDHYVGNTIFITGSTGAGTRSVVMAYDGSTRTVTVAPALSTAPVATSTYSIGALRADGLPSAVAAQSLIDDDYFLGTATAQQPGRFYGLLRIPAATFTTGSRVVRLTDNASSTYATTRAEGLYEAIGFTRTVANETVTTRSIEYVTVPRVDVREVTAESINTVHQATGNYIDPLAQTFLIDRSAYGQGVFVASVDLFFGAKDTNNLPVTVQIRPTFNGYPSSDLILAQAQLDASDVNVVPADTTPLAGSSAHRTRFTFDKPVYLRAGMEYAIVILSNSFEYELFVGEIGKPIVGDTRIIAEQPYGGSFFKSQNARTWTAEQNEDLMFNLNRAVFATSAATARFTMSAASGSAFDYDVINIQTGHLDFPATINGTAIQVRTTSADTNALGSFTTTAVDQNVALSSRRRILPSNTTCLQLNASLLSANDAVSPVFDLERVSVVTVKNVIDNGGLYGNGVVVISSGTMTSPAANSYALTITGGNGSGAVLFANTNSTGSIVSIYVANTGSGYTETPTLALSNTDFSVAPTLQYNGETSSSVRITGEQKARYITRRVTLADGFDAADIKVYISANRPTGTSIDVYYKVLGTGDTERFDDKSWSLMTVDPDQAQVYTSTDRQFREYAYVTPESSAAYTSNGNTFDRFHTFAIKIVLRSTTTSVVPRVRNLRAIAFDE